MAKNAGLMCRVLLLCAASFLLVCSLTAQVEQGDKPVLQTENEVLKVEQERDQALQQRDVAVLERIYSDQLVFVNTRGQKFTKAQRLADLGAGKVEYFSYNQEGYSYHVYGDTVVMTGRTSSVVKFQGRVNKIPRLFTNIYVKTGGLWRLAAHQATPIVDE
jgi:ketosteroid isomerase-like protein